MGFWDSVSHPNMGGGVQGAAGGAMAGFAVGGPLGAAIGGIGGGVLGAFGDKGNPYKSQMEQWLHQQALSRGPAAQGQYSQFRGNQQDLVRMLEAQARGEGPSLAAQQLREASDRTGRNQQALAAGTAGPNAALAQFQAAQMGGQAAAQNAQMAMAGRIQEQYNAQNQLGLTLHGARGQDEQMNMFNVEARNQRAQDNLNAALSNRGMQFGALSSLWGNEAGKPGIGQSLMGAGATALGFAMGQKGNQPAEVPVPQNPWQGPPGGSGMGWPAGAPAGGPSPGAGTYPPAPTQTMNPYPGQTMDPYATPQSPWAPLGFWAGQGGNPHQGY